MAAVHTRAWDEARAVLDVPGLPVDPKMLPRATRVKIAAALAKEGWPQRLIGDALGVGQARVSRWLRGDEQTWQQVAGRGASTKPKAPRAPASRRTPAVEAQPWFEDDHEPDESWWQDDDDEPEPAPRRTPSRAKPKGLYGAMTPMVVATATGGP